MPAKSNGVRAKGTAPRTTSSPSPAPAARSAAPARRRPTAEEVARRAYQIYEAEGRPSGKEVEHWLRAETDLASGR